MLLEMRGVERLAEEAVESRLARAVQMAGMGRVGDHRNALKLRIAAQMFQHPVAIRPRHFQIEEHDIGAIYHREAPRIEVMPEVNRNDTDLNR